MFKLLNALLFIYYVVMAVICFSGTIPWTPIACGFVSLIAGLCFLKELI